MLARAHQARQGSAAFRAEQRAVYEAADPNAEPASGGRALLNLQATIDAKREQLSAGDQIRPAPPILQELDTILLALSFFYDRGLELKEITLSASITNTVLVTVAQTRDYEELISTLSGMASAISVWNDTRRTLKVAGEDRIEVRLMGQWAGRQEGEG